MAALARILLAGAANLVKMHRRGHHTTITLFYAKPIKGNTA
nr:MAG TPA: hypothetical protein [Caudoviricetes sp.]